MGVGFFCPSGMLRMGQKRRMGVATSSIRSREQIWEAWEIPSSSILSIPIIHPVLIKPTGTALLHLYRSGLMYPFKLVKRIIPTPFDSTEANQYFNSMLLYDARPSYTHPSPPQVLRLEHSSQLPHAQYQAASRSPLPRFR